MSYVLLSSHCWSCPFTPSTFVTFELKVSPLWCPYKWHHMVHVNEQQSTRLDTLGSSSGRTVRLLLFIYGRITPIHHPNIDVAILASWNESAAVWGWITKEIPVCSALSSMQGRKAHLYRRINTLVCIYIDDHFLLSF